MRTSVQFCLKDINVYHQLTEASWLAMYLKGYMENAYLTTHSSLTDMLKCFTASIKEIL